MCVVLVLVFDKFALLALAMMLPPSNPVRTLPANAAAWRRKGNGTTNRMMKLSEGGGALEIDEEIKLQ